MTVKEIVEKFLKDNGYSGLYCDYCGCEIDDIMPCESEGVPSCECGYKVICTEECSKEGGHDDAEAGITWHIQKEKP